METLRIERKDVSIVENRLPRKRTTLRDSLVPDLTRGLNWIVDRVLMIPSGEVLNSGDPIQLDQNPARELRKAAKLLTGEALDSTGAHVNYKKLTGSESYAEFRTFTLSLPNCKAEDLGDRKDQIAFWINLYNSLMIDAVIYYRIEGSLLNKPSLFRRAAYNVAGFRFSADDIEHGILRGNRPNPALPIRPFGTSDPRLSLAISPLEPRIHYALVCAAESCPPISFYDGSRLDDQLDQAAGNFINGGGASFDPGEEMVHLSRIFKWYQTDFGGLDGVVDHILKYSKDEILKEALLSGNAAIQFQKYDWTVNNLI